MRTETPPPHRASTSARHVSGESCASSRTSAAPGRPSTADSGLNRRSRPNRSSATNSARSARLANRSTSKRTAPTMRRQKSRRPRPYAPRKRYEPSVGDSIAKRTAGPPRAHAPVSSRRRRLRTPFQRRDRSSRPASAAKSSADGRARSVAAIGASRATAQRPGSARIHSTTTSRLIMISHTHTTAHTHTNVHSFFNHSMITVSSASPRCAR